MGIKYIEFKNKRYSKTGKTYIWDVLSMENDKLGEIRWFGRWRKYAFNPAPLTTFEQDCLRKIADFCERQSSMQRLRRKSATRQTKSSAVDYAKYVV